MTNSNITPITTQQLLEWIATIKDSPKLLTAIDNKTMSFPPVWKMLTELEGRLNHEQD